MANDKPVLILVVGPTASGKTALAIDLAVKLKPSILSADSRQFYRELPIGTAMPNAEQLAMAQHYFIADRSLEDHLNAGAYEKEANVLLESLFTSKNVVVACGGSGLFLKALVDGFDDISPRNEAIRQQWQHEFDTNGIERLQFEVRLRDPHYAASADMHNHQRLIRALEVMEQTGRPYSELRKNETKTRPYRCIWIGLSPDRPVLHQGINDRVDHMITAGLVEEAKKVYHLKEHESLRTVGYEELFEYFEGSITLEQAIYDIKTHRRQFARRQMTWFRKNPEIHWFSRPDDPEIWNLVRNLTIR